MHQKNDEKFIKNVQHVIEKHLSDVALDVHVLERELGMSRTSLHRRISKITAMSATEYIRYVRLSKAKALMEEGIDKTISEIAYDVGFTSLSYFTRRFKEVFGVCPTEWREGKLFVLCFFKLCNICANFWNNSENLLAVM